MGEFTENQVRILQLAEEGRSLFEGLRGRSAHGGRQTAIYSLIRRGLLTLDGITDLGRAALASIKEAGNTGTGRAAIKKRRRADA